MSCVWFRMVLFFNWFYNDLFLCTRFRADEFVSSWTSTVVFGSMLVLVSPFKRSFFDILLTFLYNWEKLTKIAKKQANLRNTNLQQDWFQFFVVIEKDGNLKFLSKIIFTAFSKYVKLFKLLIKIWFLYYKQ